MKFTSAIIKRAWGIRKAAAQKYGCPVMEISWKLSLHMAREAGKEENMDYAKEVQSNMWQNHSWVGCSDKQNCWAADLRKKFQEELDQWLGSAQYNMFTEEKGKIAKRFTGVTAPDKERLAQTIISILRNQDAKFWIENRNKSYYDIVKSAYNA